jgi:hypothetical protein
MLRLFNFGVIYYEIKNGRNILVWLATWGGSLPGQLRYFASVRGLAKSPPTVQSNCSERMCLHARTFLMVALENRLGCQEN